MNDKSKINDEKKNSTYTIEDAMRVTNELFKLNKENQYNPGAFIHGLIFALEVTQQNYGISQQQIAQIRRGCRKYFSEIIKNDINKIK
jgi:hypothetical protein